MPIEFEQGEHGRFHIIVKSPYGRYTRITYLLEDDTATFISERPGLNGTGPVILREVVKETPLHRRAVDNFRRTMTILGKNDLTRELPEDDEPLTIYKRINHTERR